MSEPVTITNGALRLARPALAELGESKLPIAASLRVVRLMRAADEHWKDVEQVIQISLKAHCRVDEKGNLVPREGTQQSTGLAYASPDFLSPEDEARFAADDAELAALAWEPPLQLSAGELGSSVAIEPRVLFQLGALLALE